MAPQLTAEKAPHSGRCDRRATSPRPSRHGIHGRLPALRRTYGQAEGSVLLCDRRGRVVFANARAADTLRRWAPRLGQSGGPASSSLIGLSVTELFGNSPRLSDSLSGPRGMPCSVAVRCNGKRVSLLLSAIHDATGDYLGPVIAWNAA